MALLPERPLGSSTTRCVAENCLMYCNLLYADAYDPHCAEVEQALKSLTRDCLNCSYEGDPGPVTSPIGRKAGSRVGRLEQR